jgi:type II secretory pathway component GspD/PulD (secretin)
MKSPLLTPFFFALCLSLQIKGFSQTEGASDPSGFLVRRMAPQYEQEASKLRNLPPQQYDFAKSPLSDVLRFLANDAKLSFISLPEESPEASRIITFAINASPFQVLETLCRANGLALIPENGMWYIRPADDRELIGKGYAVRFNAMERVTKISDSGLGSVSGSGGSAPSGGNIDLQGGQQTFHVARSELINDIRAILDLQPEELELNQIGSQSSAQIPGLGINGQAAGGISNSSELSNFHKPKVLWKSDANMLYVVATRLQHMWVEGYLIAADKEQPMIGIEAKFIETSTDPSQELGLDWGGTLGDSGTFRQFTQLTPGEAAVYDKDGNITTPAKDPVISWNQLPNTDGGFRSDLANLFSLHNLNKVEQTASGLKNTLGLAGSAWPVAILSNQDLSFKLRALLRTQDTKQVSYPRMATINNREVSFRSVINQPVLGSSSSVASSGSAVASQSITYLPIGTVINVLPKKMDGDKILLNVAITISSILGEQVIAGNKYPIATSRVYSAPAEVNNGYTMAVGGLDEAKQKSGETGVPFLGRIPILGYLFKSKTRSNNNKSLMLFITPTLLDPKEGGLPDQPQSVMRQKPAQFMPQKPKIGANGVLEGGASSMPGAVEYMTRELEVIEGIVSEGRATEEESKKLTDMKIALNHLVAQCDVLSKSEPQSWNTINKAKFDLGKLCDRVSGQKRTIIKNGYY